MTEVTKADLTEMTSLLAAAHKKAAWINNTVADLAQLQYESMLVADALAAGRQAADVLEAVPADLDAGYSDDEVAAQYAAADRLVAAFRQLDRALREVK